MNEQSVTEVSEQGFELRILRALRRIMRAVDVYSRKLASEYRITGPQLISLSHIVKSEGMTLSELSRVMFMSASTLIGILDRLEAKGLIRRERKDKDRRKVILTATEDGRQVAASAPSPLQDKLAGAIQQLDEEEQVSLTASIERIVDLMEIGYLDSSPVLAREPELSRDKVGR